MITKLLIISAAFYFYEVLTDITEIFTDEIKRKKSVQVCVICEKKKNYIL